MTTITTCALKYHIERLPDPEKAGPDRIIVGTEGLPLIVFTIVEITQNEKRVQLWKFKGSVIVDDDNYAVFDE